MTTNQTERVPDEELDQMIWKLERDGMTPKMLSLMRELREVRRVRGEPVAYIFKHPAGKLFWAITDESNKGQSDVIPVYIDPPAPVVPDALADSIDSDDHPLLWSYNNGWNACRAAMLQTDGTLTNEGTMQLSGNSEQLEPVSNRDELPATQFKPVADLYGITSPTGSETSFTFDAVEAANFIEGGWTVQEYVELERYQEAIIDNFRENVNSSTNNCREISETSTNCPKCGGRGTYHCPQMLGTVECECTLPAAPKEVG